MLAAKESDLVVFNDVSREDIGFDAPDNEVVLVSPEGERRIEKAPQGGDCPRDPRRKAERILKGNGS